MLETESKLIGEKNEQIICTAHWCYNVDDLTPTQWIVRLDAMGINYERILSRWMKYLVPTCPR